MPGLRQFEEIEAWRLARILTRRVYQCSALGRFARDRGLQAQMRRAAVSIMSNIAEGFERGGSREFAQYLAVAKGSTAEVQSQLYVAVDVGYISPAEFEDLQRQATSIKRLLAGFIKYLRQSPLRGRKFVTTPANHEARPGPKTRNQKPTI